MEKTWRLLDLPTDSYAESAIALSPALMRARGEGLVPDTVAVFTFRRPSVRPGRRFPGRGFSGLESDKK